MDDRASQLLQFEFRIRHAEDRVALSYIVVNELGSLVDADQIFLLTGYEQPQFSVVRASNASKIDRSSPMIHHIEAHVREHLQVRPESRAMLGGSSEFSVRNLPPFFAWVPLHQPGRKGRPEGGVLLFRYRAFSNAEVALLNHVGSVIVHGIAALRGRKYGYTLSSKRRFVVASLLIVLFIGLAAMVPVNISTVGPAQVVAHNPRTISAPLAGQIEQVFVVPGQEVKFGDALVLYRQDELIGELRVAEGRREVARAAYSQSQNTGFVDVLARAELSRLKSELALAETDIELAQERLSLSRLVADRAGVVIIDSPDDWVGRPVQPGQRILQIVNPDTVRMRIDLPVENLIPLDQGARVSIALNAEPLNRLDAVISYFDFEPQLTEAGVLSLRIVADLADGVEPPRIGSLGTARVYGPERSLLYQIFRRPIVALRQMVGA